MEEVSSRILTVTERAVAQLKLALAEEKQAEVGIRVGIKGGGCSGYQYHLDIEDTKQAFDFVEEVDGVKIYIDPMSAPYLRGTTLDYLSTLAASGFSFSNPNATRTCGCGSSFSA